MSESSAGYQRICGVDVAKAELEVYLHTPERKHRGTVANTPEGIAQLVQLCQKHQIQIVVTEATGGLQRPLAVAAVEAGLRVAVLNPARVRHYALAQGILAKTDKVDAKIIAEYALRLAPAPTALRSEPQEKLARLVARRGQLIKAKVAEDNRFQQEGEPDCLSSISRHLQFLGAELEALDQRLYELVEQDPTLEQKARTLDAMTGVGRSSAVNLVVSMPELGELSAKQAGSLAGLAPFNKQSGEQIGERHISGGRAGVRAILYMCTLSAVRYDPRLQGFYHRLLAAGKCKMKALTACMRKLLVIANARVREALAALRSTPEGQGGVGIAAGG